MSKRWMMIGAITLALTAVSANSLFAAEKDEEKVKKETEVKMSLKDVPAEVRATLTREANGVEIKTVDMEKKDGKTVYETDVVIDGTNYEIVVGADGKLISKKIDNEEDEKDSKSEKSGKKEKKDGEK